MGPEAWSAWRGDMEAAALLGAGAEATGPQEALQWELAFRMQCEAQAVQAAQQLQQSSIAAQGAAGLQQLGFPAAEFPAEGCIGWDLQPALDLQFEFDQQLRGFDQNLWSTGLDAKEDEAGAVEQGVAARVSEDPLLETQPQKLAIGGSDGKAPLSMMASPLRVPLPEPLGVPARGPELPELYSDHLDSLSPLQPPGLEALDRPPGLGHARAIGQPTTGSVAAAALPWKPAVAPASKPPPAASALGAPAAGGEAPQGITVQAVETGGTRIEWGIDGFCGKLQSSGGRPMVSPPFSACGLPNLRLMVSVTAKEPAKSSRSRDRKGASKSAAAVKKGPLQGALKLKADCLEGATVMTFNLCVGPARSGPFTYDFAQQAVHGPDDFGVDWREQVDASSGSLRVGVEILEVCHRGY